MRITLSDEEIREALAEVISSKVQNVINTPDVDDCWFTVKSAQGEVDDIESIEFIAEV